MTFNLTNSDYDSKSVQKQHAKMKMKKKILTTFKNIRLKKDWRLYLWTSIAFQTRTNGCYLGRWERGPSQCPHWEAFTAGKVVRDIIIGVSDGLTVPFALAAGLSGTDATSAIVLTAGIAEVVAGAISMGLGGYVSRNNSLHSQFSSIVWDS